MADTKNISEQGMPNQTMQHEKAKAEVSAQRHDEKAKLERERQEKGAIGGGSGERLSQTGEPGRARNELDQEKKEPGGGQR